ncbi:hypothetical protein MNBD_GAMMA26-2047 [hydrothermal vent metagenome]|uniref:Phage-related protein n=1 Tax=hydrothermal vent metagenome TaxID=652676 RepID=A0A3B1AXN3_9ZZZZ
MKEIIWLGNSHDSLMEFPVVVRRIAGFQLHLIQAGLPPDDWKPMPTIGAGVREIRLHTKGEHRIIYIAKFEKGIYILHAFQKKSQKTAKKDLELIKKRFHKLIQQRIKQ